MPEVATLTHTHESIMNFLIANPTMHLQDVAALHDYSPAWLSCIIHSHAFQARLADKQDAMFDALKYTLTDRMTAVAHDALSIVHDGLLASPNPDKALTVADTVLHRLGYAPQRAQAAEAPVVINNFVVNASDLAAARATIIQHSEAPQAHATSDQPHLGHARPAALVDQAFSPTRAQAAGSQI